MVCSPSFIMSMRAAVEVIVSDRLMSREMVCKPTYPATRFRTDPARPLVAFAAVFWLCVIRSTLFCALEVAPAAWFAWRMYFENVPENLS